MPIEREIYTRNAVTGYVLLTAFLAAYLPGINLQHYMDLITKNNGTTLAVAIVTVVSAPFIGFAISGLVIFSRYVLHGHPYNGTARKRVLAEIEKTNIFSDAERELVKNMDADDIWVYLNYQHCPSSILEWMRRRRTAQYLGYNWMTATILGILLGFLANSNVRNIMLPRILWILPFLIIAGAIVYVGNKADKECERVEELWVVGFFENPPSRVCRQNNEPTVQTNANTNDG